MAETSYAPVSPPNLPPISHLESNGAIFFGFNEPPPRPPFMASSTDGHPIGQNHDRNLDSGLLPPPPIPPPAVAQVPQAVNAPGEGGNSNRTSSQERPSDSGDGSGTDRSDSEEEDEQQSQPNLWQALEEDKSEPCADELAYIQSKDEHSAIDYDYWEKKTFFDIDDPEIVPGESGRIDWVVEHFNGTKENPNNESMMRSPMVHIGGYDWRIKLYPKGNNTEYVSLYLECVTMQSQDFEENEAFVRPPIPFISGMDKLLKRRSVAVQLSVVMYNPTEPRVYEYHTDAHQFTKQIPDYGWTRFTRYPRREFGFRSHGQRQAMLRDDKLAFSAYVRVVQDPTGCLWSHGIDLFEDSVALTGLRPFTPQAPWHSAQLALLHFAPFRNCLTQCCDTKIVFWLQTLLWKMMSRKRSHFYGQTDTCIASDTIAWMRYAVRWLQRETNADVVTDLVGTFDPNQGSATCGNRLKTKGVDSVQAAVNAHPTVLEKPALLTLELQRQEFDKKVRKWHKLTNKVDMDERISVGGTAYTVFAFTTHCGDLESNNFNLYVRPNGPGGAWYGYTNGRVTCLTSKQSVQKYSGVDEFSEPVKKKRHSSSRGDHSPFGFRYFDEQNEVANVVMYVRDDWAQSAFAAYEEQVWDVPENVRKGIPPTFGGVVDDKPPATAVYERFSESEDANPPPLEQQEPLEQHEPPEQQESSEHEEARRSSFSCDAGYATPHCWQMDGEDVVMSDAEDDCSVGPNDNLSDTQISPDEQMTTVTIDHLGREFYEGTVKHPHKYHGNGHLIAMNGDEYVGEFKDGQKSGRGKMIYASTGNVYEGDWAEDEHHGQGTLTEAATGNVFEGGWKHGKKHGQFVMKGTVTDEDKGCCSICYDKEISTAFYDCGHVLACKDCAHKIDNCPICRKRVLARLELFGVKMIFE